MSAKKPYIAYIVLNNKQQETHGLVLSTLATDPLAKATGYQYLQCWLNIHFIGPVLYRIITILEVYISF